MNKPNLENEFKAKNERVDKFYNLSFGYASKFIGRYMKTFLKLHQKYLDEDNTEKLVELYRNVVDMFYKMEKKVPKDLRSYMLSEASYYECIGGGFSSRLIFVKNRNA